MADDRPPGGLRPSVPSEAMPSLREIRRESPAPLTTARPHHTRCEPWDLTGNSSPGLPHPTTAATARREFRDESSEF